jgi:hypothetical protein
MAMAAMGAGNVVVVSQRFTDPYSHGFLPYIQVSQTWHASAGVQFVHLLFKHPNAEHLKVESNPIRLGRFAGGAKSLILGRAVGGFTHSVILNSVPRLRFVV